MAEIIGNEPLTLDDFVVVMNALLIEVYADLDSNGRESANEKLIGLANRLDDMARQISIPERAAIVGGISHALMQTERGG